MVEAKHDVRMQEPLKRNRLKVAMARAVSRADCPEVVTIGRGDSQAEQGTSPYEVMRLNATLEGRPLCTATTGRRVSTL